MYPDVCICLTCFGKSWLGLLALSDKRDKHIVKGILKPSTVLRSGQMIYIFSTVKYSSKQ